MKSDRQLGSLDYFKIVAALLVVAIHTSPLTSVSSDADFIFTRIIARIAVPFFLMVTGYFILPQYLFERSADLRPLCRFVKKALLLYAAAMIFYLPVNIYAGHFAQAGIWDVLRMIVFDGTLYHLWYLPASVLGMLLVVLAGRRLPFWSVTAIALILYVIGLLGDSYFGVAAAVPVLQTVYEALFRVFSYTRNGLFYVPIFLIMGAWLRKAKPCPKRGQNIAGFVVSGVLMIGEGLLLRGLGLQRHDSMYIMLLPCMFFLFQAVLSFDLRGARPLRVIATIIYLIHPLFIVLVHGAAKAVHLTSLWEDHSLLFYLAVCVLSCAFAVLAERLISHFRKI